MRNIVTSIAVTAGLLFGTTQCDTPRTETADTNVYVKYDCDSFVPLLEKYGLPVAKFKKIMKRESHCDPEAYFYNRRTKDNSYGLLQLNLWGKGYFEEYQQLCGVPTPEHLFEPEWNVKCAAALKNKYGMRPWS